MSDISIPGGQPGLDGTDDTHRPESDHTEFQSSVPLADGGHAVAVDCSCDWIDPFPYSTPEAAHHAWAMHTVLDTPSASSKGQS